MSVVATLLDKARARKSIPTDMALAERLGRSRAVVSEWRSGSSYPDEDMIVHLAELAGDDPGEWLLAVRAVRAEGPAKKAWLALSKRLAMSITLALCVMATTLPGVAKAATTSFEAASGYSNAYYVKYQKILLAATPPLVRWLLHLLRGVVQPCSCNSRIAFNSSIRLSASRGPS